MTAPSRWTVRCRHKGCRWTDVVPGEQRLAVAAFEAHYAAKHGDAALVRVLFPDSQPAQQAAAS